MEANTSEFENSPSDEELNARRLAYLRSLASYIEGFDVNHPFEFHDSEVVNFCHNHTTAYLTLMQKCSLWGHQRITLLFEEIERIDIGFEYPPCLTALPGCDCYPASYAYGEGIIVFDTEYYKIECRKIKVKELIDFDSPENLKS